MAGIEHTAGRNFTKERKRAADIIGPAASVQGEVRFCMRYHIIAGEIAGIIHADEDASGRMTGAFSEVQGMTVKR